MRVFNRWGRGHKGWSTVKGIIPVNHNRVSLRKSKGEYYYCGKCGFIHRIESLKGEKHRDHKVIGFAELFKRWANGNDKELGFVRKEV